MSEQLKEKYLDYFLSKEKRESYILMPGKGNIMISTPHSVEQTRDGQIKFGEYETGVLAMLLHDKLNCPVICKTFNNNDDANFDEKSNYKDELEKYIKSNNIKYLIDLHQLSPKRIEMVDIGTGKGNNLHGDMKLLSTVNNCFAYAGINPVCIDKPFAAALPITISSYIASTCKIPCVQIEINSKLLCSGYEEYKFFDILEVLENIVKGLNEC